MSHQGPTSHSTGNSVAAEATVVANTLTDARPSSPPSALAYTNVETAVGIANMTTPARTVEGAPPSAENAANAISGIASSFVPATVPTVG